MVCSSKILFAAALLFLSSTDGAYFEDQGIKNIPEPRFGFWLPLSKIPVTPQCPTMPVVITARCICGSTPCAVGQICGRTGALAGVCVTACPAMPPLVIAAGSICGCQPGGSCTGCGAATVMCTALLPICVVGTASMGVCVAP